MLAADQRDRLKPATVKGTLTGAALPPCHRPQRGSQSRGRPPPGARSSPGLSPRDQPQGVTSGNNPREPTRRSSGVATISPSAATQRNPKTPKGEASASQGRQGQGNDGRTYLPPRFRPFSVRPQRVPSGGTRFSPSPAGTTPGESLPVIPSPTVSPWTTEPGSRCSHREPPGKPRRHRRPAARTQPRPR